MDIPKLERLSKALKRMTIVTLAVGFAITAFAGIYNYAGAYTLGILLVVVVGIPFAGVYVGSRVMLKNKRAEAEKQV